MSEKEQFASYLPGELKERLDVDPRPNTEILEAALWTEFGGHSQEAIERRKQEKKRRIHTIEEEIESRKQEIADLKREIAKLNRLETEEEQAQEQIDETVRELAAMEVTADASDPAVVKHAKPLSISASKLASLLADHYEGAEQ